MYNKVGGGKRLAWIDGLKAFAMFSVVLMHVETFGMDIDTFNNVIGPCIAPYYLAIFFFISGFVAYKSIEVWQVDYVWSRIKKKVLQLILPAISFAAIWCVCFNRSFLGFFEEGRLGYWFPIVLFEYFGAFYVYSLVCRILKIKNLHVFLFVTIAVLLYAVNFLPYKDRQWWSWFEIERSVTYVQFFAFGLLCSQYKEVFFRLLQSRTMLTIASTGYVVCLLYLQSASAIQYRSIPGLATMAYWILFYFACFTVLSLFYNKRKWFEENGKLQGIVKLVGQRSLDIYLLHYLFIPKISFLKNVFGSNDRVILELFTMIVIASLITICCLAAGRFIRSSNLKLFLGEFNHKS